MKKLLFRLLISLVLGGGMLYLASRSIDFSKTFSALAAAKWWVLFPYFAAMAVQHYFRAVRWSHLLGPIRPIPFSRILPIATVGFMAIIALPLRMGEFVRPYLIADPPHIRMSQGLGTMAVERVFDGLILSLTCFIAVAEARTRTEVPGWILIAGLIAFGLFFAVLVALIMALWKKEGAVTLCRRIFSIISPKLGEKTANIAEGIVDGFLVLPDIKLLLSFLFCTVAYWFFNAVAIWVLSYGFGLDLTLWGGIGVMVIVGIGIMIPGGPGFIGNFEQFAFGALGLYVGKELLQKASAGYILTFHVTNALWYAVFGALAMFSPEVSFTKVWQATTGGEEQNPGGDDEVGSGIKKMDNSVQDADADG